MGASPVALPGSLAAFGVTVGIILGYILFRFLCTCQYFRRNPRRKLLSSLEKLAPGSLPPNITSITADYQLEVNWPPPSYEQCMITLTDKAKPRSALPSYTEFVTTEEMHIKPNQYQLAQIHTHHMGTQRCSEGTGEIVFSPESIV